ncbi:patatin-like phospholipase family protein [Mariniflexile jejuense]|uniref:Patatin-like phospholipase family protein n=1 Tax=Mariniflexile jejuense TaxID=1173582 RepID=A0ABW3JK44_9FLAO
MGKTLKICLAMGGGVSLGSFSGSALTEALKLLILYGQDRNGKKYDKVIVDGMSGASAGAIALTIMLKSLIDYKSMLKKLLKGVDEDILINEIASDYFGNDDKLAKEHPNIEELKALQVAQKIQEEIWVNRLTAQELFGTKKETNFEPKMHESFGLLDRELLEQLAEEFIIDPKFDNLDNIRVLDKGRVLFACSLTNLLPIEIKKDESELSKLEKNVVQSVGAQNHTELRIMDFVFDKTQVGTKGSDSRWLKFTDIENEADLNFNLNEDRAWSIICSSVLACGAFPIAFEPVLLRRYRQEFDGDEAYEKKCGQWPVQFNDLNDKFNDDNVKKTSVFNEELDNALSYSSFNFPYIDGGTFNNEPIREAFRIGAFQDFGSDLDAIDRLILFVDPIVRKEKYQTFSLSSLFPVEMDESEAIKNDELSKLFGVTSNLITSLKNQGRIKEEHKISDVKQNFNLRDTIFSYLDQNEYLGGNLTVEILKTAYEKIKTNLGDDIISLGTRNVIDYFQNELTKACISKVDSNSKCLKIANEKFKILLNAIDNNRIPNDKFDPEGYKILEIENSKDKNLFARAVFKIIFDFSLNTYGKNPKAERVAILPINSKKEVISLPGEEVSAFGGFASKKARQYAFHYARLSTLSSLSATDEGFRKKTKDNDLIHPFILTDRKDDLESLFTNQINKVNFFDDLDKYQTQIREDLVRLGLKRMVILVKNKLSRVVMLGAFAISLAGLIFRIPSGINWFVKLLSEVVYFLFKGKVEINYVNLLPVTISILSNKKLSIKARITTTDDNSSKIKMVLNENKKNKKDSKYQYLFQVHRALYKKDSNNEFQESDKNLENKVQMQGTVSLEPSQVEEIALTLQEKVKLPNFDGNLNQEKMTKLLESSFQKIIHEIRIDKYTLPSINDALKDKNNMLRYSFLNIEYHLNPLIEINVDHLDKGWYFKENTEALHKKFLRLKNENAAMKS